jgi:hypothetical protein
MFRGVRFAVVPGRRAVLGVVCTKPDRKSTVGAVVAVVDGDMARLVAIALGLCGAKTVDQGVGLGHVLHVRSGLGVLGAEPIRQAPFGFVVQFYVGH